jgi:lipid II:glycine glycyltransferase (peptidoglycan interpeptide bridge formation enzyme)
LRNPEIEIFQSQNIKNLEIFNNLYQETVDRHHFTPFSLDYLKNELLAFQPDNQISIFLGRYKKEVISAGIFIFWQNIAFYHHGASSLKYPKIPVSYLLQWEAIKEAKKRGCKLYNFWGIASIFVEAKKRNSKFQIPNSKPRRKVSFLRGGQIQNSKFEIQNKTHPWYGLTLFKMGFGGYKKEYVKTQDFPLSEKYWLNYIIEKLRKAKRGL